MNHIFLFIRSYDKSIGGLVEKSIYQAQSLKQSYSQAKTKTSHLLSPNRDPCVTILSVTVKMLYMHAL